MTRDGRAIGGKANGQQGAKGAGPESNEDLPDEFDLSSDMMGRNKLQGSDQGSAPNQRQSQAEGKGETDDLIESFEKLDDEVRAREDLGKGNRSKPGGAEQSRH